VSVKAVRWKGGSGGKDLRKRYLLSLELKRVYRIIGVMDNDSGYDGTDELCLFFTM